jgi:hypothetical protein
MSDSRSLVAFFVRRAKWAVEDGDFETPQAFLRSLMEEHFTVLKRGRMVASATANGRSTTFALPETMSPREIVEIAELAYQQLENGGQVPMTYGNFSCIQR